MHVIRLLVLASVLSGCFYTDPINQRPSIAIHQSGTGPVVRGQMHVGFSAISNDPDGDTVAVSWRAYACDGTACDSTEFDSGTDTTFDVYQIPYINAAGTSFDTLEIRLEGHDALGATAKPSQTLDIHLGGDDTVIRMRADPRHAVVKSPIGVYAIVTDGPTLGRRYRHPPCRIRVCSSICRSQVPTRPISSSVRLSHRTSPAIGRSRSRRPIRNSCRPRRT